MQCNMFFDLMAELISEAKRIKPGEVSDSLTKSFQDALAEQVNQIIISVFGKLYTSYDKFPVTSENKDAILQQCRDLKNYYLYRAMICFLDGVTSVDKLSAAYAYNSVENIENHTEVFIALNSNYDTTGVRIMMRVKGIRVDKSSVTGRTYPQYDHDADYWMDDINSHLENTYYEDQQLFDGIEVDNILVIPNDKNRKKNTFDIAFAPISNEKIDELLSYNDDIIREDGDGHPIRYFGNISVQEPDKIKDTFIDALKSASKYSVDLLTSVEMLGTKELCEVDKRINSLYSELYFDGYNMPELIVPPSYWHERRNSLSVFSSNGYLLGAQDKATRYKYHGKNGACDEDLDLKSKKIRMWHVPGVGRIVFMICSDFLVAEYRRFVASVLKATLIICPAFSAGTREFDLAINSLKEYGTTCVWLNCCSAIATHPDPPDYIGLVSTPIVREDGDTVRIKPRCRNSCRNGCCFLIRIPKNAIGHTLTEDLQVTVEHCIERCEE